jgi:hypothetical protein
MTKQTSIGKRLQSMKRGESFTVGSEKLRQDVLRAAQHLTEFDLIDFQIITRKNSDGKFIVAAI